MIVERELVDSEHPIHLDELQNLLGLVVPVVHWLDAHSKLALVPGSHWATFEFGKLFVHFLVASFSLSHTDVNVCRALSH